MDVSHQAISQQPRSSASRVLVSGRVTANVSQLLCTADLLSMAGLYLYCM